MKNRGKQIVITVLAIVSLIVITVGVSYSFFTYTREGTTENVIKSGSITFLYTEVSKVGRGIELSDAYPISDEEGKMQTGEGKVFDFKVTSTTSSSTSIPYEVTARKKADSTLDEEAVKVYLTEVDGEEIEILLDKYSNLEQTSVNVPSGTVEKTIYTGIVPANNSNYEKNFRLRMWIDSSIDFSPVKDEVGNDIYSYNNKTFILTVNVYANGEVVNISENTVYTFDYTGDEQVFTIPATGRYKIETWGAQGGSVSSEIYGGYGSYSTGIINLKKNDITYINVGGSGVASASDTNGSIDGGYNGGGSAYVIASSCSNIGGSGGGATHIASVSGLLSSLENDKENIIIVAGGGGGAEHRNCGGTDYHNIIGGSGGGLEGNSSNVINTPWQYTISTGGTQETGGTNGTHNNASGATDGTFGSGGQGNPRKEGSTNSPGGGGGLYGGGAGMYMSGGGGSGYIGNTSLYNKVMYCYNCQESLEASTKTISTTCTSETPTENCTKQGNGYVRVTYLGN